jgi:hypothetical protein
LQPIEIEKQGSQVAVTTAFSEMGWEMPEAIEMIFRDAIADIRPSTDPSVLFDLWLS